MGFVECGISQRTYEPALKATMKHANLKQIENRRKVAIANGDRNINIYTKLVSYSLKIHPVGAILYERSEIGGKRQNQWLSNPGIFHDFSGFRRRAVAGVRILDIENGRLVS